MRAGDVEYYDDHAVYCHPSAEEAKLQYAFFECKSNRRLLRNLAPRALTLDVGCGYGAFTAVARDYGLDAYGIDFNAKLIEVGRDAFGLDKHLQVGSIDHVKDIFPQNTFNLITMFEVIEHVEEPRELINTAFSLLSPGGLLVLSCPNEDRWMPCGRIFVDFPPHHLTRWSPGTLKQALAKAGFEDIKIVIDSSVRDWIWTFFVNRSANKRIVSRQLECLDDQDKSISTRVNWLRGLKRNVFVISKYVLAPLDMLIHFFGIGTMGMRTVARKPNA
jgi:2-polyprenyl-3-methyl-5-hydroxy-6-metoxy-1,4-benzoquinol methylase